MIFCQSCLTGNKTDAEVCRKCGNKLLVLGGNFQWEEPDVQRVSIEDHFLERISNLEETTSSVLEHLSRLADALETQERNNFVTRSGLSSLVETLKETNLLREEFLYQRWETTMIEQMVEARYRDRFMQMRGRFMALYRGKPGQLASFQALIDEAEFLIFSDRFQESVELLCEAAELDPENYELAYYLGEILHQQGMIDDAIDYLKQALKAKPDHADALLMLALISYADGQPLEAKTLLRRSLEIRPNKPIAMLSLASILVAEGDFKAAEPLLIQVNEIDPQAQSFYLLGLVARETGKLKRAIDLLNHATELDPDHEDAVFTLGMAYLERGWTRKANACFSKAMELNPSKIEYREPPLEPEAKDLSSHVQNWDDESDETLAFAEKLVREHKVQQALPHFRHLIRKHPTNSELLTRYAALIFAQRRYDETLKVVRRVLMLETSEQERVIAYTLRMESFRALGRYDETIETLNEMAEAFPAAPGKAIASYGLAITKADRGEDLHGAERLAREALELAAPEFRHQALDALGWVYFKQGRYEEALELLENAISLRESINHLYHYGMILLALNLQEKAFKAFERTVQLRKESPQIEDFIFTAIQDGADFWSMSEDID